MDCSLGFACCCSIRIHFECLKIHASLTRVFSPPGVQHTVKVKYFTHITADKRLLWLVVSVQLSHSVCPPPPFCLSSSLYLLSLRRTHSFKLISHEPPLIVWLQSPHTAAMVTGGVYSCSERKFNTSFDDISRMKRMSMCPHVCVCVCARVFAQVHLIYLTDLYPTQKATGVGNSVICAVWQYVLYERYCMRKWEIPTDTVQLYVTLSASSPKGYRICQWMEVLWVLSVSTSLYLLPNLPEEGRMPLLVSNQCIRAICYDRLREMFDSEVPFPIQKRKLDGIFALCHTSLSNWQSHCKRGGGMLEILTLIKLTVCTVWQYLSKFWWMKKFHVT